jgi:hypothetical protein
MTDPTKTPLALAAEALIRALNRNTWRCAHCDKPTGGPDTFCVTHPQAIYRGRPQPK